MQAKFLLLSCLLLSVGCPGPPPPEEDMKPVAPDMRKGCAEDGTKSVGEACTNTTKCDCSGPKPTCAMQVSISDTDTATLTGGYCSNTACTIGQASTCGDEGTCTDYVGTGDALCLKKCGKGGCRPDYACLRVFTDGASATSKTAAVCLPREGLVDCDPTADPTTQCTKLFSGQDVAPLTNGNPNGACTRFGALNGLTSPTPDDVGECLLVPCQIGPKNCPNSSFGCFYFDVTRNLGGAASGTDKFKGNVCLPAGMAKNEGDACMGGFNTCGDNKFCYITGGGPMGVCRQLCFTGTQPTFTGGNAMFKNAAAACPAGRTCKDEFGLMAAGAMNWAGICLP